MQEKCAELSRVTAAGPFQLRCVTVAMFIRTAIYSWRPQRSALTSSPSYGLFCIILIDFQLSLLGIYVASIAAEASFDSPTPETSQQEAHLPHVRSVTLTNTSRTIKIKLNHNQKSGGIRSTESRVVSGTTSAPCLSSSRCWAQFPQTFLKEAGFRAAVFRFYASTKDNFCDASRSSISPPSKVTHSTSSPLWLVYPSKSPPASVASLFRALCIHTFETTALPTTAATFRKERSKVQQLEPRGMVAHYSFFTSQMLTSECCLVGCRATP